MPKLNRPRCDGGPIVLAGGSIYVLQSCALSHLSPQLWLASNVDEVRTFLWIVPLSWALMWLSPRGRQSH